ncbi:sulfotransferase family 2 domain-containing protein [Tritonibacter mobilis]|uniref:sulfotransferase family 2 domain-containing protein n=1 Tax=Tritonibacter mobilis TaxID=379347 RepID=UPI000E0DB1D1|nr:sulfotransferase family 2 domain-containing protein [Tritonibacter mobilis]
MTGTNVDSKVIFLHIPKTAGQTIHTELTRIYGKKWVSPVRVHTQAGPGIGQLPPGYKVYSGHIDWDALESVPEPRFVFTVLRDPLERIASFYFYLRRQAKDLTPSELSDPSRIGMKMALENSPDEYFFGGTPDWQRFVRDHYHSPYCSYLVTRHIRGYSHISNISQEDVVALALRSASKLSGVYSVDGLAYLEKDLKNKLNIDVNLTGTFVNADPNGKNSLRWPRLVEMVEKPETLEGLKKFAAADQELMSKLGLVPGTR